MESSQTHGIHHSPHTHSIPIPMGIPVGIPIPTAALIESRIWSIVRRYFQWPWTISTPSFKISPLFDAEYLINGTTYRHSFNEIPMDLHTPYSTVSFRMALSDFKWLSKIFNDTKRCAVSLRQLSFLLKSVNICHSYALNYHGMFFLTQ